MARRAAAIAQPACCHVQSKSNIRPAPRTAQMLHAESSPAAPVKAPNKPSEASPTGRIVGHIRKRTYCVPDPWSSTAIRIRAAANAPLRTSRSQRAKSCPWKKRLRCSRSQRSTQVNLFSGAIHFFVQNANVLIQGKAKPGVPRRRQNISPYFMRPDRRATG